MLFALLQTKFEHKRRSGRSQEQTMASKKALAMQPGKKICMTLLPQDIVELILVRLPVSTLLRCHGVCKQWDGIIRDPQFAMAHIQCAPRRPLFFFQGENLVHLLYPSEAILFDEAWSPSKWVVPVIEPDDFLCASCNGLICLYSDKSTIKIANLATGECMHLVKPVRNSKTDHFSYYSFGFHPVTKQYKENADKMGMEINLDLQQTPDLDSSLRLINWLEYRRVLEILCVNLDNMHEVLTVMNNTTGAAHNKESHVADQGTSSSAVGISGS
uniref:F-box domain-containing protein n=1 Tax=Oryza meridionalis TaxID=40149 RepID=A0A0E0ET86_9ORYZ